MIAASSLSTPPRCSTWDSEVPRADCAEFFEQSAHVHSDLSWTEVESSVLFSKKSTFVRLRSTPLPPPSSLQSHLNPNTRSSPNAPLQGTSARLLLVGGQSNQRRHPKEHVWVQAWCTNCADALAVLSPLITDPRAPLLSTTINTNLPAMN